AADLAAAKKLITDGKLDVLITNEQAQTPASEELTKAAKDKNVATVNVNENPDRGTTYFDYVDDILKQLENACDSRFTTPRLNPCGATSISRSPRGNFSLFWDQTGWASPPSSRQSWGSAH